MRITDKYIRLCVSDNFMLYINRKDNIFGNFVNIGGLANIGQFETFSHTEKLKRYRFKSDFAADFFFETANLVMNYQDGIRNYLAPINYAKEDVDSLDNNWINSSIFIGPYQHRTNTGKVKPYDRDVEIHNAIETSGYVSKSPKSDYIVLDTARIDRNGLFYIYNLLIKPEDITSGYNPNGLATVDISGFVSENDAENYVESSLMFNYIARKEEKLYNQHCQINDRRIKMFKKITSETRSDEK